MPFTGSEHALCFKKMITFRHSGTYIPEGTGLMIGSLSPHSTHQTMKPTAMVMFAPLMLGNSEDVDFLLLAGAGRCGDDNVGKRDELDPVLNSSQSRTRSTPPPELDRSNIVLGCIL